jgi:phage shock protein A
VKRDEARAKGWFQRAWSGLRDGSWKTKAVVGVLALVAVSGLVKGYEDGAKYMPRLPDHVTHAELAQATAQSASDLVKATADQKAQIDDLNRKVDALGEKFDGLSESIGQLQTELSALESAASKPPAKITTGSIARREKKKPAADPDLWQQMKSVLP